MCKSCPHFDVIMEVDVQITLTHLPQCSVYASLIWVIIGSDNGLSSVRRETITWTNTDLFPNGQLGTNFNEIRIKIQNISIMKLHLKIYISAINWHI